MAEIHYLISDASKKVDVESHVLRYWEDELELRFQEMRWDTGITPKHTSVYSGRSRN